VVKTIFRSIIYYKGCIFREKVVALWRFFFYYKSIINFFRRENMPRGRKPKSETMNADGIVESGMGPIDVHVGARISARRKLLQLSQKELADRLGITFQQVQKYEKGVNRIGAGRLYSIATILGVDINYFYSDVDADSYMQLPEYNKEYGVGFLHEDVSEPQFDPLDGAEATMLLKAFYALPARSRTALLVMLTSLRDKDEVELDV
jgi:transcriptional regulator with XRE-family HTH domain